MIINYTKIKINNLSFIANYQGKLLLSCFRKGT